MKKGLDKFALRLGAGFFVLLILFGTGYSHAKPPLKNTPLYKHLVKRGNAGPVRLYERESASSSTQEEVPGRITYKEIKADKKEPPAEKIEIAVPAPVPARLRRVPVARRAPANLTDPATFTPDMPFSEAVNILRNSSRPQLNIVVLWKDLEANADIFPDTPIGIDGVTGVSLGRHLKSLVEGVSGGAPERLGYFVEDGVVVIATVGSLPKRLVTRIYDITDLVGQPSTGFPPMGMMGMGMMGGMMPGMGGGMMGGMMPGMGGGMMGGMMPGMGGGMMGGMMPGMGGGYGNLGGGGFGNFGSSGLGSYGTSMGFR